MAHELVIKALEETITGLEDWRSIYSLPARGEAQMAAYRRFGEHHGMLGYILYLQQQNRAALALLKGGTNADSEDVRD
jgi:hypothetical protein